jgi:Flp pilus assembly protein protease CpaA
MSAELTHTVSIACSIAALALIAIRDLDQRQIKNLHLLTLLVLAMGVSLTRDGFGTSGLVSGLAAGGVLSVLGLWFWHRGFIGGGDAKLFLPVGVFVGWSGLTGFALLLLPASLVVLGVLRLVRGTPVTAVPYALPVAIAATGAVLLSQY